VDGGSRRARLLNSTIGWNFFEHGPSGPTFSKINGFILREVLAVPEPSSALLLFLALPALAARRRRGALQR